MQIVLGEINLDQMEKISSKLRVLILRRGIPEKYKKKHWTDRSIYSRQHSEYNLSIFLQTLAKVLVIVSSHKYW